MAQDLESILVCIEDRTAHDRRTNRVQPIAERRHNSKIPPAALQPPKQVGILIAIRCDRAAVCHHDICGQEIVTGCSVNPHEPTISAAQRKSGNADLGICPAANRQTAGLSCAGYFPTPRAALGLHAASCRIDSASCHERPVDPPSTITDRCTGTTASASPHRDEKLVLAGKAHCPPDILLFCGKGYQRGSPIDPAVP